MTLITLSIRFIHPSLFKYEEWRIPQGAWDRMFVSLLAQRQICAIHLQWQGGATFAPHHRSRLGKRLAFDARREATIVGPEAGKNTLATLCDKYLATVRH
jgi:hypothetical protein